ncbi:hypothetical protein ACFL1P_01300, partial [Patescibacteria group bacterium]
KKSLEARIVYEANILALQVELKHLMECGNINAKEWYVGNGSRLRISQAKKFSEEILKSNSQDWWKDKRKKLHKQFSK